VSIELTYLNVSCYCGGGSDGGGSDSGGDESCSDVPGYTDA